MDVDRIREALKTWESWRKLVTRRFPKAYDDGPLAVQAVLAEAARLVVEADEVWWCEEHNASGDSDDLCWPGAVFSGSTPCVMEARLLVPPKESE